MSKALVSVCIPCHNAGPYIGAALDSVLNQTWTNVEIIVVDDDSTDNSSTILDSYRSRGIVVVRESLGSAAKSRNRAAQESQGEYIKFFDADDLMNQGMLEAQVKRLLDSPHDLASAKWGRFTRDNPASFRENPESVWQDLKSIDWLTEAWQRARPMMQPGIFLLPRKVWELAGPWNEELTLIDDFEFFTRAILAAENVRFTSEASLYYRSGLTGSLSKQISRSAIESARQSLILGTAHLLEKRNDEAAKLSCANLLQDFIHTYYPQHADLLDDMKRRVAALGGSTIAPEGPPRFQQLAKVLGWKLARRIQRWMGH